MAAVRSGTSISLPDHVYFLTVGIGLVAAFAAIVVVLPLLRHLTDPDDAQFE